MGLLIEPQKICRCNFPCSDCACNMLFCSNVALAWQKSGLSACWNHRDDTHPLSLWNHEWLLGTPNPSKTQTVEQCHLSRQCSCPQRASWMYSWAPWEPSEVSEDCAGGYMNKFPNKTRQLWPTCELQNWNQVGSRVQIAQNEHQIATLLL